MRCRGRKELVLHLLHYLEHLCDRRCDLGEVILCMCNWCSRRSEFGQQMAQMVQKADAPYMLGW